MKLVITVALLASCSAHAVIFSLDELVVDFTKPAGSITNATWSDPDKNSVLTNGLGWDGKPDASRDYWIQSIPVAIGLAWRPASGASVEIKITPQLKPRQLSDGRDWPAFPDSAFVRYSADKKHWSSWQALEQQRNAETNRIYGGLIQVPRIEHANYSKLYTEWEANDVPWNCDEEACVKWILQRESDFFSKQIPFAGYVQFRIEGELPSGQRIENIQMRLGWSVSGLQTIPKNPEYKRPEGAWRFEAP